jgi:hypothetical protein
MLLTTAPPFRSADTDEVSKQGSWMHVMALCWPNNYLGFEVSAEYDLFRQFRVADKGALSKPSEKARIKNSKQRGASGVTPPPFWGLPMECLIATIIIGNDSILLRALFFFSLSLKIVSMKGFLAC